MSTLQAESVLMFRVLLALFTVSVSILHARGAAAPVAAAADQPAPGKPRIFVLTVATDCDWFDVGGRPSRDRLVAMRRPRRTVR